MAGTTSPDRLFRTFAGGVRQYLRRRLPTETDAEDVLQDVFLRITENVDQLQHADKAQAWVYAIARRAVADFYRRRERRSDVHTLPDDEPAAEEEPPDRLVPHAGTHDVHEEVLSWLRPMIDELPEKYARPLRWADVEGLKQQEVADRLGLSLSGAKSRIQRARRQLGEVLAACCTVEFGPDGRATSFQRRQEAAEACCEE